MLIDARESGRPRESAIAEKRLQFAQIDAAARCFAQLVEASIRVAGRFCTRRLAVPGGDLFSIHR